MNKKQTAAIEAPEPAVTAEQKRLYYYRPLRAFNGAVWKCAGHGAENPDHRKFYQPFYAANKDENVLFLAGVEMLPYIADRIRFDHKRQEWMAEQTKEPEVAAIPAGRNNPDSRLLSAREVKTMKPATKGKTIRDVINETAEAMQKRYGYGMAEFILSQALQKVCGAKDEVVYIGVRPSSSYVN